MAGGHLLPEGAAVRPRSHSCKQKAERQTHTLQDVYGKEKEGKKKKVCIYITAAGFFNNLLHFWPRALLCSTEGRNKSDWLLLQVAPLNYSFTLGCLPIISLMPSHALSLSLSPPPPPSTTPSVTHVSLLSPSLSPPLHLRRCSAALYFRCVSRPSSPARSQVDHHTITKQFSKFVLFFFLV